MNEAELERRMRFQFDCSQVVWREPTKRTFAQIIADRGKFKISLPTAHPEGKTYDDEYLLQTLIHELCHVGMPGELWALGDFTEDVLERVIEPRMMTWMSRNPRRHSWWLRKLREAKKEGA